MNKKLLILPVAGMVMAANGQTAQPKLAYPETRKCDVVDTYFGTNVPDPYRWLENDTSAETAAWVAAQNKVTSEYLRRIHFRDALLKRLTSVADYEKIGAPFKKHGKYYFFKNDGLQNQSVLYVQDNLDGTPRVMLDPNKLSADGTVALTGISFSHDGKYMAYTISRSGSDWTEIYVIDTKSGQTLSDHIVWAKFTGASWQGDGFYYSAYDAPEKGKEYSNVNENHKIYYHKIGTPQQADRLVYENKEHPKRFYSASVSEDETMLFLFESGEGNGNALYVKDLTKADAPFVPMATDFNYQYSPVEVTGGKIYIHTNYGAPKYRLMTATAAKPGMKDWQELVSESAYVLSRASVIGGKMLLTYDKDAANHAYVYTLDGRMEHEIKLPSLGSVGFSGDKDDKECFFTFTSFTIPGATYKYDIERNTYTLLRAPKVDFNADEYTTEQVFYPSKDGTKIPMFLTYRKDLKRNGQNPVYLYGYGGFSISLYPGFSSSRIPFLEVARMCNVSGAAIHQRVQKLTNLGILKGSEYVIDPEKVGYETCAYIGLFLKDPGQFDEVAEALRRIPEVVECHFTTGQYDLFIKIYARNNHHLMNIIHDKLQPLGLARSETIISFREVIKRQMPIDRLSDSDEDGD